AWVSSMTRAPASGRFAVSWLFPALLAIQIRLRGAHCRMCPRLVLAPHLKACPLPAFVLEDLGHPAPGRNDIADVHGAYPAGRDLPAMNPSLAEVHLHQSVEERELVLAGCDDLRH